MALLYDILKDYLSFVNEMGVTHRTQARSISSVRSFFKFLVYDGILEANPSKLLEAPKVGRKLTALKSAPPVTKWDAKEWRKVWGDTGFWIFARSARCLMMLNTITRDREVPLLFRNNTSSYPFCMSR